MSTPLAHVEVRDPTGQVARVPLIHRRAVIGRSEGCEVHIDAAVVSRRHAELTVDPFGRWWVRDLGSRNGTLVNGKPVRESVVTPNDTIGIESYIVRVLSDGKTPAETADPPGAGDGDTMEVTLSDDMGGPVRRLSDLPPPAVQAAHLTELTRLGRELLTIESLEERQRRLCDLMVSDAMRGRTAMVLRLSRDGVKVAPKVLVGPVYSKQVYDRADPYVSRTLLAAARQSESAVIASNTGSAPSDIELSIAADVMQVAAIACPLRMDGSTIELLYVTFPSEFGTPEWLALAKLAGDQFEQAGAAWAARRVAEDQAVIENELQRARKIQMSLVPRAVSIAGLDVALGFEPCKWVGGDYADVVPFGDGRVFIIVADVCGKGMQAALITACLHTLVHTSVQPGATMTQMIARFNDYLESTLPADSFVTAVTAALDPATGHVEIVNCGHPPAMVASVGASGTVRRLQVAANPPLGCMAPIDFESQMDTLDPGHVLAMYTDGLSELVDDKEAMLGVDGVDAMLRQLAAHLSVDHATPQWAEALRERLAAFRGEALPQDDQCFLLLRRV